MKFEHGLKKKKKKESKVYVSKQAKHKFLP